MVDRVSAIDGQVLVVLHDARRPADPIHSPFATGPVGASLL